MSAQFARIQMLSPVVINSINEFKDVLSKVIACLITLSLVFVVIRRMVTEKPAWVRFVMDVLFCLFVSAFFFYLRPFR
jgi:hypothetical protein